MNIASYIEQDLRSRIGSAGKFSGKLTLSALAAHYRVSFTPVKRAIESLIRDGVIVKGDNGRLSLNPNSKATSRRPSKSVKKPSSPADWDSVITEEAIRLSLTETPVYLREESTAERFGLGRTVIRQVFNRLAGAGLIERVPRRGWQVHPFREQDMLDYIDVRETLELQALDRALPHLEEERLEEFLLANSPDTKGRPRLDNGLHQYWIETSGNRYIRAFFSRFGVYYSYLFAYATDATSVIEEKAGEHRSILKALLRKNGKQASRALRDHIRSQRPNVATLFAQLDSRTGNGIAKAS